MRFRNRLLGVVAGLAAAVTAHAQEFGQDPPCDIGPPLSAMSFYLARGPSGACGPGCSEWIAAQGSIQWDTYKRLIAFLEKHPNLKLPVVIDITPISSIYGALTIGRIFREHGLDTTAGFIEVIDCIRKHHEECLALKRSEQPVRATIRAEYTRCDTVCLLLLAGGVSRYLPPDTKVSVGWGTIRGRMCTVLSDEHREGITASSHDKMRLYLRQMGVSPELADMFEENSKVLRTTDLTPQDLQRLKLVNTP